MSSDRSIIVNMKTAHHLIALLLLTGFSLESYHYLSHSTLFYRNSYKEHLGIPHGKNFAFQINSSGFKDLEFAEKSDNNYRILTIGDSFAFGSVPYKDSVMTLVGFTTSVLHFLVLSPLSTQKKPNL